MIFCKHFCFNKFWWAAPNMKKNLKNWMGDIKCAYPEYS